MTTGKQVAAAAGLAFAVPVSLLATGWLGMQAYAANQAASITASAVTAHTNFRGTPAQVSQLLHEPEFLCDLIPYCITMSKQTSTSRGDVSPEILAGRYQVRLSTGYEATTVGIPSNLTGTLFVSSGSDNRDVKLRFVAKHSLGSVEVQGKLTLRQAGRNGTSVTLRTTSIDQSGILGALFVSKYEASAQFQLNQVSLRTKKGNLVPRLKNRATRFVVPGIPKTAAAGTSIRIEPKYRLPDHPKRYAANGTLITYVDGKRACRATIVRSAGGCTVKTTGKNKTTIKVAFSGKFTNGSIMNKTKTFNVKKKS